MVLHKRASTNILSSSDINSLKNRCFQAVTTCFSSKDRSVYPSLNMSGHLSANRKYKGYLEPYDLRSAIRSSQRAASETGDPSSGNLTLSVTLCNNKIDATLQPDGRSFNLDDLTDGLSIDYQRAFLSVTRKMYLGATPGAVTNNGIEVAANLLNRLPGHHVSRVNPKTGASLDCEIIISTNSRAIQDLPIVWSDLKSNPAGNRKVNYLEGSITGMIGFKILFRLYPDSGRSLPLTRFEIDDIHEAWSETKVKIPKRPGSEKRPFTTLPKEMIIEIAKFFIPDQLTIGQYRDKRGHRDYDEGPRVGRLGLFIGNPYDNKRPDLKFFRLNKKLRDIAWSMTLSRTKVALHSELMSRTFKQTLEFLESRPQRFFLERVKNLTLCMVLAGDTVVRSPPGSSTGPFEAVDLEAGSKAKLHNIWELLDLREREAYGVKCTISSIKQDRATGQSKLAPLPRFDMVFSSVVLDLVQEGRVWVRNKIDGTTTVQVSIKLPEPWGTSKSISVQNERPQILEAYRKAVKALTDPMMRSFTRRTEQQYECTMKA